MNIFITLGKWASRQSENFITDSFAVILTHLLKNDPHVAGEILGSLTDGFIGKKDASFEKIEIRTQVKLDEFSIPDLVISTLAKVVVVEVKTGAPLGENQLEKYRMALNAHDIAEKRLILLTHQRSLTLEKMHLDHFISWYEMSNLIDDLLGMGNMSNTSQFLLGEFLLFLQSRNLAMSKVQSEISNAIWQHRNEYQEESIEYKRVKSICRIGEYEELIPLHNLLQQMGYALERIGIEPKFDSGQHHGGWIGYNLHNMKYWFFISYTSPDFLFFETELETGQVNSSQSSQPRIGEYIEKGNSPHWRNSLNLGENSGDFFQLTRDKQQEIILEFARESYNQAKIVNPLPNLTPHTPDRALPESKRRDLP